MSEAAGEPRLRPMRGDDVDACLEIFYTSQDELYDRLRQPRLPRGPTRLRSLIEHLRSTDPALAWVAEGSAGLLAFLNAVRRDDFWYLSFLFVLPEAQAAGLGRRLLGRALPEPDDPCLRATCVDSLQPVSTGLYSTFGLVPRAPIFTLIGRPRPGGWPRTPRSTVRPVTFEEVAPASDHEARLGAILEEIDREVLGFSRPLDHRVWGRAGRVGTLFLDTGRAGAALGYGYRAPSGGIGPLVLRTPELAPDVLGQLFEPPPPDGFQLFVPGPFAEALAPLVRAGLRFEGPPALLCATEPLPALDRCLVNGFALL